MPNGRCRMHGGTARAGIASGTFKDGRYSKVLPTRLLDRYREALADSELLALREDVALLEARELDLLTRMETGESSQLWHDAQDAYREAQQALVRKDVAGMRSALMTLGDLIERGHNDRAAWADVLQLLREKRGLVESERKRLVEMQQMVTATEVMTLVSALSASVRAHISDPEILKAISADLLRLIGPRGEGGG